MILKISNVKECILKSRRNRIIGNILVAEIVKTDTIDNDTLEKNIFNYLSNNIQKYKIPRIIRFVDKIKTTRTGKKERK